MVGSTEVNDIVAGISSIVAGIMALFKLFLFVTRTKEIKSILERLEMIYFKMRKDDDTRQFILEAENIGRKLSLAVVLVLEMAFPIAAFIIAAIDDILTTFRGKHMLLKVWIPWRIENIYVHLLTNTLLTLITIACLSVNAAFFVIELTFSLYIAAYIKQLEQKLIKNGANNQEIYEQHNFIMQLIADYNGELSGQMYLEAVIAPLMPCGYGLAAIRMESLHRTSYMINWYEEEPELRKDLLILMTKTTSLTTVNYKLFAKFDHVLLSATAFGLRPFSKALITSIEAIVIPRDYDMLLFARPLSDFVHFQIPFNCH
ncbi:hypothetical protein O3M35_002683 [Rhynocoris fuscipes]|uniref:Odorant receptor n=1 Tax=Rhynocoris fuscipes TaxID=488301 RepID=A0AAW1CML6_9HEMI